MDDKRSDIRETIGRKGKLVDEEAPTVFVVHSRPYADNAGRTAATADLDTLGTIHTRQKVTNDTVSPKKKQEMQTSTANNPRVLLPV